MLSLLPATASVIGVGVVRHSFLPEVGGIRLVILGVALHPIYFVTTCHAGDLCPYPT
jgi:hypothetical protein